MLTSFKFYITIFIFLLCGMACKKATPLEENDYNEWYSGGKQTVFNTGAGAFSQMFFGLTDAKESLHEMGDIGFEATFNADITQLNHGLGPIFNNQSCGSCHIADGRGKSPNAGEKLSSLLIRLSTNGMGPHGEPLAVPGFGGQLQQRGIYGIQAEADVLVSYEENTITFDDGETINLRKPTFNFTNAYQNIPSNIMLSPRMASPVFGLGLLEAINEQDIIALADEYDVDNNGISGKPNYAYDVLSQKIKLGRFGWKAAQTSIIQQSAGAYNEDMGITNLIYPNESTLGQIQYQSANEKYELADSILYAVAFYIQTLAVPGRRNVNDETVKQGKIIFKQIGCSSCHVAMQKTGVNMAFPELSNQIIFPYSDLLLHDMGEELADYRPDHLANGYEWRTPPLWGIGLTNNVNGHNNFLHDGRARSISEAIMWHGGEGTTSKLNFKKLSKSDRKKLLAFLNSL
jgi:CxxC motif-containing protein (DUF1111 family)